MHYEELKELIANSALNKMQKIMLSAFVDNAEREQDRKTMDRRLIEQVANEKELSEVILSTDEVVIYTVYGKSEWDTKYPYRSIFLNEKGEWERNSTVSPNVDLAYLVHLQRKHLGPNSQFVDFAIKMLDIKIDE